MYKLVPWTPELDLTSFYSIAESKGFKNNCSQRALVDCFNNEPEKQVWIFYYNDQAVGSVAAHTFDIMGENSYRICARTCLFSDMLPINSLRTLTGITTHQNYTAQFLIPICIEWAPPWADLYITSNNNEVGTQQLVHKIFCPALKKKKILSYAGDYFYRGLTQSVWKLNSFQFYEDLSRYPRWSDSIHNIQE